MNLIVVITTFILYFSLEYLSTGIISSGSGSVSAYGSKITEILVNHMPVIMFSVFSIGGIFNIVSAIQNKEDKKLFFWQLVLGLIEVYTVISIIIEEIASIDLGWLDKLVRGVIPIILAIINLVCIRKSRPKVLQVISYVGAILLSIFALFFTIVGDGWLLIIAIMQLIYTHLQNKM